MLNLKALFNNSLFYHVKLPEISIIVVYIVVNFVVLRKMTTSEQEYEPPAVS